MKTAIKVEAIILAVVVLAAVVLTLISAGALMWLKEPVVEERQIVPLAIDPEPAALEKPAEETDEDVIIAQQPVSMPHSREITAQRYFVYDVRDGVYLQQKGDLQEKLYPASITKLLTVYVVLQYMDPEDTVVVGDALSLVQPDSSLANLKEGDRLTVAQLIEAMMLPSGNDAAQTAAVAAGRIIAGDSGISAEAAVRAFVEQMNLQAVSLGMTGSHFANPDGFHDDSHYTTMKDLTVLATKVLADPTVVSFTSKVKDEVTLQDRTEVWKNTNFLLNPGYEAYIPNTIGLKTGYTSAAGSCLMSAFFVEDRLMLIGVFGCPAHTEDRYLDTAELYSTTVL